MGPLPKFWQLSLSLSLPSLLRTWDGHFDLANAKFTVFENMGDARYPAKQLVIMDELVFGRPNQKDKRLGSPN